MLVGGLVSTVTVGDDWVQQLLEDLVGLLVTSNTAHSHDEGVTCWMTQQSVSLWVFFCVRLYADDSQLFTRVVNTSLDHVVHGETAGGGLSPQLTVDLFVQHLQQEHTLV